MVSCEWWIKSGGSTAPPFKNPHVARYDKSCIIFCGLITFLKVLGKKDFPLQQLLN